jgi:hypothetical protein
MKTQWIFLIMSVALSANAFANCEDGAAIAEQGAKSFLKARMPGSEYACAEKVAQTQPNLTQNGESWLVNVGCTTSRPFSVRVDLREAEDAVCVVAGVAVSR